MTIFASEYTNMIVVKNRELELHKEAENARLVKSLREEVTNRIHRIVRINNDPTRR